MEIHIVTVRNTHVAFTCYDNEPPKTSDSHDTPAQNIDNVKSKIAKSS